MINSKVKGYTIGAIAAASYGLNPMFALPLYQEGMTPDSVLFFRYMLAIPIMGILLAYRRGLKEFEIRKKECFQFFGIGVLMALSSLFLFLSYTYMDVGIASTLLFIYPIMVAVMMAIGFYEKLSLSTGICMVLALCGIFLLHKNEDGNTISLFGTVLVMLSSLTYAIYIVYVNQSGLKNISTLKVTFYMLCFGLSVFIVKILVTNTFTMPVSFFGWVCILGLSVFPTAVSFLCTTSAIHYIGATPTAILGALEPVTAVAIGVSLFGEVLTTRIVIGILLILFAVSVVVYDGKSSGMLIKIRKLFPINIKKYLYMDLSSVKLYIENLRKDLNRHNYNYYVLNSPQISDIEFDKLMKELESLEQEFPEFVDPLSPTQRVGSDLTKGFEHVVHVRPMMSLSNSYSIEEVDDWFNRVKKSLAKEQFNIVGELKFDGTSISITYKSGRMIRAVTRGDGTQGDDVTANVKTIKSIPLELQPGDWPEEFEIRGEILMPWDIFEKLNAEREYNEEPLFANPRNAASGTLKMQDPKEVAKRHLDARFYYLLSDNLPYDSHYKNMEAARSWGFKVSSCMKKLNSLDGVNEYIKYWDIHRKELQIGRAHV